MEASENVYTLITHQYACRNYENISPYTVYIYGLNIKCFRKMPSQETGAIIIKRASLYFIKADQKLLYTV